ncbi:hypothetical protein DM860_016119 [Cuscuta australis]|uniref:Uncharacterized protein n=1 Tax=Cuscuta australis TaxID=267555 RepID=A0A328E3Y1_9ASTE|nr:hypothetical protein DM860_016119 [Cuscuta australis]
MGECLCDNQIILTNDHVNNIYIINLNSPRIDFTHCLEKDNIERQNGVISDRQEEKVEAIRKLCFSLEDYRNKYQLMREVDDIFTKAWNHCIWICIYECERQLSEAYSIVEPQSSSGRAIFEVIIDAFERRMKEQFDPHSEPYFVVGSLTVMDVSNKNAENWKSSGQRMSSSDTVITDYNPLPYKSRRPSFDGITSKKESIANGDTCNSYMQSLKMLPKGKRKS